MSQNPNDAIFQARRSELLDLITSMGFPTLYAQKAIDQVDPTKPNAAELCFHWMEEHPLNAEPENQKKPQEDPQLQPLMAMGFSRYNLLPPVLYPAMSILIAHLGRCFHFPFPLHCCVSAMRREESARAMHLANNDLNRAIFYILLDKVSVLKRAIEEEEVDYKKQSVHTIAALPPKISIVRSECCTAILGVSFRVFSDFGW